MDFRQWMWRLRESFSKILLVLLLVGLGYGGYRLYKEGAFNHGLGPAVSAVLQKVPYFGTRFRHHFPFNDYSSSQTQTKPYVATQPRDSRKFKGSLKHRKRSKGRRSAH